MPFETGHNSEAYERLIREDIKWLEQQHPRTIEREHIKHVLLQSVRDKIALGRLDAKVNEVATLMKHILENATQNEKKQIETREQIKDVAKHARVKATKAADSG